MLTSDTIAAIATPTGTASIGVIRISGPETFDILRTLCAGKFVQIAERKATRAILLDPETGEELDDVVYTAFRAPKSYTGEDVVEISCHGSSRILRSVLESIISCGCRIAEPGEFTRRAFLNGKMDLSQAEAVNDLILSKTEASMRSALRQLRGGLSEKLEEIDGVLLEVVANIEASIDFPDDVDEPSQGWIGGRLSVCIERLEKLRSTYAGGRILREGARMVICGGVNVGKSSLLNALLRHERAIVTDIPGTTRDLIEEGLDIGGVPLTLVDTAGIRKTDDPVESVGLEMAMDTISGADISLLVVDASRMPIKEDLEAAEQVEPGRAILVINKSDIAIEGSEQAYRARIEQLHGLQLPCVIISAVEGSGIAELEDKIYQMLTSGSEYESVLLTNARHYSAILGALTALRRAQDGLEQDSPPDLLCIDIAQARRDIGLISGKTIGEDVLDSIFSRFCIGK